MQNGEQELTPEVQMEGEEYKIENPDLGMFGKIDSNFEDELKDEQFRSTLPN